MENQSWLFGLAAVIAVLPKLIHTIHQAVMEWTILARATRRVAAQAHHIESAITQRGGISRFRHWLSMTQIMGSILAMAWLVYLVLAATDGPMSIRWAAHLAMVVVLCLSKPPDPASA